MMNEMNDMKCLRALKICEKSSSCAKTSLYDKDLKRRRILLSEGIYTALRFTSTTKRRKRMEVSAQDHLKLHRGIIERDHALSTESSTIEKLMESRTESQ